MKLWHVTSILLVILIGWSCYEWFFMLTAPTSTPIEEMRDAAETIHYLFMVTLVVSILNFFLVLPRK